MKKLLFALFVILLVFGCSSKPVELDTVKEGEQIVLFDSFEDYDAFLPWAAVASTWGDNDSSTSVEVSDVGVTDGARSLALNYKMILRPDLNDATIGQATFNIDQPEMKNWKGVKGVLVDFTNNTKGPIKVYAAVCTGASWFWHQTSPKFDLEKGATRNVRFSFVEGVESADTGWQPTGTEVKDLQTVMRFTIRVIAPVDTEDTIYIDNVRLIK
ncbi:MAG: hypothetical protein JW874_10085 [Spirochaetales bacterium]|nr:hypothetical protein [Spirochaetales bacterium]